MAFRFLRRDPDATLFPRFLCFALIAALVVGIVGHTMAVSAAPTSSAIASAPLAVAPPPPFCTAAPLPVVNAPGGSTNVTLTFNSTGFANGTYTGDLCIESNDPDEAQVRVSVTLRVGSATAV